MAKDDIMILPILTRKKVFVFMGTGSRFFPIRSGATFSHFKGEVTLSIDGVAQHEVIPILQNHKSIAVRSLSERRLDCGFVGSYGYGLEWSGNSISVKMDISVLGSADIHVPRFNGDINLFWDCFHDVYSCNHNRYQVADLTDENGVPFITRINGRVIIDRRVEEIAKEIAHTGCYGEPVLCTSSA